MSSSESRRQEVTEQMWCAAPTLLEGEFHQRGVMVPGHEDILKPEWPACNLSVMELSASVIVMMWSHFDDAVYTVSGL